MIPWESFQSLRSLTYKISSAPLRQRMFLRAEVNSSEAIFSGPSHLPQLQHVRVIHSIRLPFADTTYMHTTLDTLYLRSLNKTVEDPTSFPCLQTFRMELICTVMMRAIDSPFALHEENFVRLVADRSPIMFGPGGRRKTHGWTTSIVPSVRIVTLP